MRLFLINMILALIWAALTTDFKAENIFFGFCLSFFVLVMTSKVWSEEENSYIERTWLIIKFMGFILLETFVSSVKVARDVLRPRLTMKPGVIAIPLDVISDLEITLVANIISFTPGSLTLDVSEDRKQIFVHTMFAEDIEGQRENIKKHIERRIAGIIE